MSFFENCEKSRDSASGASVLACTPVHMSAFLWHGIHKSTHFAILLLIPSWPGDS